MRRWLGGSFVVLALACAGPPIPQEVVDLVAEDLCALGHPQASFVGAEIVGSSSGSLTTKTHDRFVDVAIRYERPNKPQNTMTLRIYLVNAQPCEISLDVLSDDGPAPVLLDNALASKVVGDKMCAAFTP